MRGDARKKRDALLVKAMEARARNQTDIALELLKKAATITLTLKPGRRRGSVISDAQFFLSGTANDDKPYTPFEAARMALLLREIDKVPAKRARFTDEHFARLAAKLRPEK